MSALTMAVGADRIALGDLVNHELLPGQVSGDDSQIERLVSANMVEIHDVVRVGDPAVMAWLGFRLGEQLSESRFTCSLVFSPLLLTPVTRTILSLMSRERGLQIWVALALLAVLASSLTAEITLATSAVVGVAPMAILGLTVGSEFATFHWHVRSLI